MVLDPPVQTNASAAMNSGRRQTIPILRRRRDGGGAAAQQRVIKT
jgi:hypothetical protein